MGKPEVSIIVPVYNVAPYLDKCVESLEINGRVENQESSQNNTCIAINCSFQQNICENIENDPNAETIMEIPSADYEVADSWTVGWSDDAGGRKSYTLAQINDEHILDNAVVFNSISDGSFPPGVHSRNSCLCQ